MHTPYLTTKNRITVEISQRNVDILTEHGEYIDDRDGKSTIHFKVPFRGTFVFVYDWKGQRRLTINPSGIRNQVTTAWAFIEHFKLDA